MPTQATNNNKRILMNTLLLYLDAVLDGCIIVYKAMFIVRMLK